MARAWPTTIAYPKCPAYYLIIPCPLDLGPEFLNRLMHASVASQLGLYTRQVHAPLSTVYSTLVLLYPRQQVLQVA